jgi:tRNA uridine 5-carbamoylmethylation protein Kti12
MSKLILISGAPGSGKSSTADALAEALQPAVKVYTDEMRHQVAPYAVPWTELGRKQLRIAIEAVCATAEVYLKNDYNVVMNDVLIESIYPEYGHFLHTHDGFSVLLQPPLDVVLGRDKMREDHVPEERITELYSQFNSHQFDLIIDNSGLTVDEVVQRILGKFTS